MKLYLAGPLFTTPERTFNSSLAELLEQGGHEVFLPQDQEPGLTAGEIFRTDRDGIDWADALVAIMDGPDPDSGTSWECGYAYGKKPIVLLRTDFRLNREARSSSYNPMLTQSATIQLDMPLASVEAAASAVLAALLPIEVR